MHKSENFIYISICLHLKLNKGGLFVREKKCIVFNLTFHSNLIGP